MHIVLNFSKIIEKFSKLMWELNEKMFSYKNKLNSSPMNLCNFVIVNRFYFNMQAYFMWNNLIYRNKILRGLDEFEILENIFFSLLKLLKVESGS